MPRTASVRAPRKVNVEWQGKGKAKTVRKANEGAAAKNRIRRDALEIVETLEKQLQEIQERHAARVQKLETRINRLKERNASKIEIARLLKEKTPEELSQMLEEAKQQQRIIRKASKALQKKA